MILFEGEYTDEGENDGSGNKKTTDLIIGVFSIEQAA